MTFVTRIGSSQVFYRLGSLNIFQPFPWKYRWHSIYFTRVASWVLSLKNICQISLWLKKVPHHSYFSEIFVIFWKIHSFQITSWRVYLQHLWQGFSWTTYYYAENEVHEIDNMIFTKNKHSQKGISFVNTPLLSWQRSWFQRINSDLKHLRNNFATLLT